MTRYYFHVRDGNTFTRDEEGVDLPDMDAVRWEAQQGARGFKKLLLDQRTLDHQRFEILDEAGNTVLIFPFSEAKA